RGVGELRDDRRRGDRGAQGADRLRRPARHRADRAPEAARGLPARRVPAREGRDRHDRGSQADARQVAYAACAAAGKAFRPKLVKGRSLPDWLAFIERQHPQPIALGLDRAVEVFSKLKLELACPILTVGGTNGKGSTCAMLEGVLQAAGYRTGLYTSPHLLRYNERVRIGGREASDAALVEAFAAVEAVRGNVALTYFEFGTLAAFFLFAKEKLDALILEVGLGGRLD